MGTMTYKQVWELLTVEEQKQACLAIWQSTEKPSQSVRPRIIAELAEAMHFREKYLARQTPEHRAEWLYRCTPQREFRQFLNDLLRAWLLVHYSPMVELFLSVQNIQRDGCFVRDEAQPPTAASFQSGIQAIRKHSGDRPACIYLGFMVAETDTPFWANLPPAIRAENLDIESCLRGGARQDVSAPAPAATAAKTPEESAANTTLDNLLIKTIVASALETEGSLSSDTVEHLVDEVIDLSADRQRSHLHRGFFHALFDRNPTFDFPGANNERKSWYACGFILGLLRKGRHSACLRVLKDNEGVARLLSGGTTTPCGPRLFPHLYGPMRDAGEFGML